MTKKQRGDRLERLDSYSDDMRLNKGENPIASYIEEHGTEKISTASGTGFYADKEDSYSKKTIGISGSPLYDAEQITYKGDFKIEEQYGVELNSYYEETHYSRTYYYFRDQKISFSPDEKDIVYSGEYLFCFDSNGYLTNYCNIG